MSLARTARSGLALVGALALIASLAAPTRAQGPDASKDAMAVFNDIDDLDKLRVLNPVKLTAEQLDRIIPLVEQAAAAYGAKLDDVAITPLRAIASEVRETRTSLLRGGALPRALDDKIKKLQDEFVKRRKTQEDATLKGLSDAVREVLSAEQIATAAKLAKSISEEQRGRELKGTDAQWFNYYVLGTFVQYPRILPLLKDMRKALQ